MNQINAWNMEYINAVMVSWYSTKCHLQRRRRSFTARYELKI